MPKPASTPPPAAAGAHPFGKCLYFTVNAVARHITRMAEDALSPTGLCPSGAMLLSLVVDSPGLAPSEAAGILHLAPSSVTRFADTLQRRELVERRQEGRQVLLFPTPAGRKALKQVKACWEDLYERYSTEVGVKKGEKLADELCQVADLLSEGR